MVLLALRPERPPKPIQPPKALQARTRRGSEAKSVRAGPALRPERPSSQHPGLRTTHKQARSNTRLRHCSGNAPGRGKASSDIIAGVRRQQTATRSHAAAYLQPHATPNKQRCPSSTNATTLPDSDDKADRGAKEPRSRRRSWRQALPQPDTSGHEDLGRRGRRGRSATASAARTLLVDVLQQCAVAAARGRSSGEAGRSDARS